MQTWLLCRDKSWYQNLVSAVKKISLLFSLLKIFDENTTLAKLVVDTWGNCSSRLCQSTFAKFNTFQILLFCLYFRKFINSLLNYPQLFQIVLRIFDLECHGQAPLKIAFVKFGHIFRKFRKLRSLHLENKNSVATELSTFTI